MSMSSVPGTSSGKLTHNCLRGESCASPQRMSSLLEIRAGLQRPDDFFESQNTGYRMRMPSQGRTNLGGGFRGRDYLVYFKVDQVTPLRDPLLKQGAVVRFHHLVAAVQRWCDPGRTVGEPIGQETALSVEPAVNGRWVAVLEMLDHHVQRHKATKQ